MQTPLIVYVSHMIWGGPKNWRKCWRQGHKAPQMEKIIPAPNGKNGIKSAKWAREYIRVPSGKNLRCEDDWKKINSNKPYSPNDDLTYIWMMILGVNLPGHQSIFPTKNLTKSISSWWFFEKTHEWKNMQKVVKLGIISPRIWGWKFPKYLRCHRSLDIHASPQERRGAPKPPRPRSNTSRAADAACEKLS